MVLKKCEECGREVSNKAETCPHCSFRFGDKTTKNLDVNRKVKVQGKPSEIWYLLPIFMTIFGGIIGYFALRNRDRKMAIRLLIIGFVVLMLSGVAMTFTTPPAIQSAQPSPSNTYSMNQAIQIGDMEYKVTSVSTSSYIGYGQVGQSADGVFVIVTVHISNNGKDTANILANDFKMADDAGRKFDTSTASVYLSSFGYQPLLFKELSPGLSTEGSVVFDVPKSDMGLVLRISGTGIFSGTKDVNIGDVSK